LIAIHAPGAEVEADAAPSAIEAATPAGPPTDGPLAVDPPAANGPLAVDPPAVATAANASTAGTAIRGGGGTSVTAEGAQRAVRGREAGPPGARGAGPDGHPIAEGGMTFALLHGSSAQGHPVIKHDVVADLGGLSDHHPHAVVDEEATADLRTRVNLDPGEGSGELAKNSCGPA
jgi:hypothetical protein